MSPLGNEDAFVTKVQSWANNCGAYEQQHRGKDQCAAEYYRGGKEAFQRVVDALRNTEVGTNGSLSQRWRSTVPDSTAVDPYDAGKITCAYDLDAAKLRIEEAVKALPHDTFIDGPHSKQYERHRDDCNVCAVLKIIREIL